MKCHRPHQHSNRLKRPVYTRWKRLHHVCTSLRGRDLRVKVAVKVEHSQEQLWRFRPAALTSSSVSVFTSDSWTELLILICRGDDVIRALQRWCSCCSIMLQSWKRCAILYSFFLDKLIKISIFHHFWHPDIFKDGSFESKSAGLKQMKKLQRLEHSC